MWSQKTTSRTWQYGKCLKFYGASIKPLLTAWEKKNTDKILRVPTVHTNHIHVYVHTPRGRSNTAVRRTTDDIYEQQRREKTVPTFFSSVLVYNNGVNLVDAENLRIVCPQTEKMLCYCVQEERIASEIISKIIRVYEEIRLEFCYHIKKIVTRQTVIIMNSQLCSNVCIYT